MPYSTDQDEKYPYTTIGTDEAKIMIEAGAHVIDGVDLTSGSMVIFRKRRWCHSMEFTLLGRRSRIYICLKMKMSSLSVLWDKEVLLLPRLH